MEIQIQLIQSFHPPFEPVSKSKYIDLSPKLDKILWISNANELTIAHTSSDPLAQPNLVWRCPQKCVSVAFSENCEEFLAISPSWIVHRFICDTHRVHEAPEDNTSLLNKALQEIFRRDFLEVCTSLSCLVFSKNFFIFTSNSRHVFSLRWNPRYKEWTKSYAISHTPFKSAKVFGEHLYILTESDSLLIYFVETGLQTVKIPSLPNLLSRDLTSSSFCQMAVSQTHMAIADSSQNIFIFLIEDVIEKSKSTAEKSKSGRRAVSSSVDHSQFHSVDIKSAWSSSRTSSESPSYQLGVSAPSTAFSMAEALDRSLELDYVLVTALDGCSLCAMSFSGGGLSAWYWPTVGVGLYRLYNLSSGTCVAEESLEREETILLSKFLGSIDVAVSPTSVRLFLCNISKQQLTLKVLQTFGIGNANQVLRGPGWYDLEVALTVLSEALEARQLDSINFANQLFLNGFQEIITNIDELGSPLCDDLTRNTTRLTSLLFSGIEDNMPNLPLAEKILFISLNHLYDLLDVLGSNHSIAAVLQAAEQTIMEAVVKIRGFLYQSQSPTVSASSSAGIPPELEGLSSSTKDMWQLWNNLPPEEIVYQAVTHCFVPLAITYLVQCKGKSQEGAKEEFSKIVHDWVLRLIDERQFLACQNIFANMGKDAFAELKTIFLNTTKDNVQEILYGYLSGSNILNKEEGDAYQFLLQFKQSLASFVMHRAHTSFHGEENFEPPFSVTFILEQPVNWRDLVKAEMLFACNDSSLGADVSPNAAWIYLLQAGRIDLFEVWMHAQYSSSASSHENEKASQHEMWSLFSTWTITQDMIDSIVVAEGTKLSKDLLLDCVARYGIFSTAEKSCLNAILTRFVRTRNLVNIPKILSLPSSSLTLTEFNCMLLKFCVQYKIGDVLFSCLADCENLTEVISLANEEENSWLKAWYTLIQLDKDPRKNLLPAVKSSLLHLSLCNSEEYLERNPLLAMALILLDPRPTDDLLQGDLITTARPQDGDFISMKVVQSVKQAFPVLEQAADPSQRQEPDITLYELLENTSAFDISRLFGWQKNHKKKSDCAIATIPNFSPGNDLEKYAYWERINFQYYLKLGRPMYAYCSFIVEQFKKYKTLNKRRKKQACNIAHGLALCNFMNKSVVAGCVSFVELLGMSSDKLRLHISVGNAILKTSTDENLQSEVGGMLKKLLYIQVDTAPQLLSSLETALVPSNSSASEEHLKSWSLAVKFARTHSLPLPEALPAYYAENDDWLHFVTCMDLYQYPLPQALSLTEKFSTRSIHEHLYHAFSLPKNKSTATYSPRKEQKIKLRDARKFLYSRIGFKDERGTDTTSDSSSKLDLAGGSGSISSDSSSAAGGSLTTSVNLPTLSDESELFPLLLSCHASPDPPRALLEACLTYNHPVLAVLATCYESCSLVACMGTWLVSSLTKTAQSQVEVEVGESLQQQAWSSTHIKSLLITTLGTGHVATLAKAFSIFVPLNPLCPLLNLIKQCVVDKNFEDTIENIKLFKARCQGLPIAVSPIESGSFLLDRHWTYSMAVQLICTALAKNFSSSYHQYCFLQILCKASFSEYIPVEAPDFAHLLQLQECLLSTGVQLDYTTLCLARKGSERELQACLDRLVLGHYFPEALKFSSTAGLPRDAVVIAQWNYAIENLEESEEGNHKFWDECQDAFESAGIQTNVAAEFFHHHAESRTFLKEKFYVLKLAHCWYSRSKQQSARKRPDCYLTKAVEVELSMWRTCLMLKRPDEIEKTSTTPQLFTKTRKDVLSEAGIEFLDINEKLEEEGQIEALNSVIGELLNEGDVITAVRLEALFSHKSRDVQLILTCLGLAEGEILPYQLSAEHRTIMEKTMSFSGSFKRRPLHSLRTPSFSSLSLSPQQQPHTLSLGSDYSEAAPRDQQEALTAIEKLAEGLKYGRNIGARIAACYRVAINIGKPFVEIITMEDTLGLLKMAINQKCQNKFAVASDLSSASQISKEDVAMFLCEEIMCSVSRGHMQGLADCPFPVAGGLMWGCELDSSFHLVLELCPEPTLLGNNLLSVGSKLNFSQPEAAKQVFTVIVELLVRAHDCFTAACDMEGIAAVLQRAREITCSLLQHEQWPLMVRLITGIGRYTEMSYIFQLLKDHDQFEFLLGKGMDKVPGLKLALLDFVRSRCAQDRELLRLVALHFQLYVEVAQLWAAEARASLHSLLSVARMELGIKPTVRAPPPPFIKAGPDATHVLTLAMHNFSHASEYYLQADKMIQALNCAHQAELVAIQISLVNSATSGQMVDCLLQQQASQVAQLITQKLSFPQATIVARAYGHHVDWGAALFHHCVLQGESKYLTNFKQAMNLTPNLVEDVAKRFQREKTVTAEMTKSMRTLVSGVQNVEIKYRVASQLGFKDVLESMLNSPELPYLKDTIWRRGIQRHHSSS